MIFNGEVKLLKATNTNWYSLFKVLTENNQGVSGRGVKGMDLTTKLNQK